MTVAIDLTGQVALVTGASRGIGREVASALAAAGCAVALAARDLERLEALAAELAAAHGVRTLALALDVKDAGACDQTVKRVIDELGKIDILVNNAGVTRDGLLARMSIEDWSAVLDTNLTGAFLLTKAASRAMMRQRSGRIVNISSVIGIRGNAGQANYAASKAGLIGFSKAVARELASRGVTVNVVAPGFVDTDMTAALGEDRRKEIVAHVPLGRVGQAADVASAVVFLASPLAGYITGAVLPVDGGFAM